MENKKESSFDKIIYQYLESLDALREFSKVVEPYLVKDKSRRMKKDVRELILFTVAFHKMGKLSPSVDNPKEKKHLDDLINEIEEEYKDKVKFIVTKKGKGKDAVSSVNLEFIDEDFSNRFHKARKGLDRSYAKINILRQSVLVSAVSNTEWFLSEVLFEFFTLHPEPITEASEKTFSYKELIKFGSFEEIKTSFIKNKIRGLLYEGLEAWLEFINKKLKVQNDFFSEKIDHIKEIFLRRNLIIHNGGKINTVYLDNLPNEITKNLERGKNIGVSEVYIEDKIKLLEIAFVLLGSSIWKQAKKDEVESRTYFLTDLIVNKISQENYFFAKTLSEFLLNEETLDHESEIVAKINYWQCFKWDGRIEEVRQQIIDTDFSGLKDKYELGRFALLDKTNQFFDLLPSVMKNSEINLQDLKTWPIFQKIRRTKKYKEFLTTL